MEPRRFTRLASLLLALLLVPARMGAQESLDAARGELFSRTSGRLAELADWCQERRLYLERDRLYEALLELDPEHDDARRFLRYRRTKDGWRREKYSAPENRDRAALVECAARRAALAAEWRAALLALAERPDDELDPRRRARLLDDLLILAPDGAEARRLRGEIQLEGGWILAESAAGRGRRAHLLARVRELRAAPPAIEARGAAQALPRWHEVRVSVARAVSSGADEEALRILGGVQTAVALFREVFDEAPILPAELAICVLGSPGEKRDFLDHHPLVDPATRQLAERFDSLWIPESATLVVCGPTSEARRDHAARQVAQRLLQESYGIDERAAWVIEGFSLRLGELVTGSSALVRSASARSDAASWREGEELWNAARELLDSAARPQLAELFALPQAQFTREHVLLSYALACYLCEGRAPRLARILDELGNGGRPAAEVLEQELDLELEALEARLVRWAAEMGA